jgi:hypothetical protein
MGTIDATTDKSASLANLLQHFFAACRSYLQIDLIVTVSEPFLEEGKWFLISGSGVGCRRIPFSTLADARHEFDSICSFGAGMCGDAIFNLILIPPDEVCQISDTNSYLRFVERALRTARARNVFDA